MKREYKEIQDEEIPMKHGKTTLGTILASCNLDAETRDGLLDWLVALKQDAVNAKNPYCDRCFECHALAVCQTLHHRGEGYLVCRDCVLHCKYCDEDYSDRIMFKHEDCKYQAHLAGEEVSSGYTSSEDGDKQEEEDTK